METSILNVPDPHWNVTQILAFHGYNGLIPSNTIINKRRPSLGATQGEIEAFRNTIIIVPFVTVTETKKAKYNRAICAVYEDSQDDIEVYLQDETIHFKKILTTPESFPKVIKSLKRFDASYRSNFFVLIDECEKLIQSAYFRRRIFEPMNEFFKFKQKALISATPMFLSDNEFEQQGFKILDLKPSFDYKQAIDIIGTNNVRTTLRNCIELLSLRGDDRPVFLFTNCRKTILYFTQLDLVRNNCKIFCAQDLNQRFFSKNNVPSVHYSVREQCYAPYNAFTSRFFAAVDMFPEQQPHILIVTNLPFVQHSVVDPATDVVQIYGRARNKPASITHITNFYYNEDKVDAELRLTVAEQQKFTLWLKDLESKTTLKKETGVILAILDKLPLSDIIELDGNVNPYLRDNYNLKNRLLSLYSRHSNLLNAYIETGFFKPTYKAVYHTVCEKDNLKVVQKSASARRSELAQQINYLFENFDYLYTEMGEVKYYQCLLNLKQEDSLIFQALVNLGFNKIKQLRYSYTKIKAEVLNNRDDIEARYFAMIDCILITFRLHKKLYCDELKAALQDIYQRYDYWKPCGTIYTAKATDISKYFSCKYVNGKKKDSNRSYFILYEPKLNSSRDLRYLIN